MILGAAALERASAEQAGSATVVIAGEADASAWDTFVSSHPGATGYHLWAWRRVFAAAFKHEPIYLISLRDGTPEGVLPLVQINSLFFGRTLTSLPFLNYGGVVASSDDIAQALLNAAAVLARDRRCSHVEFRHVARRFSQLPFKQHKVTMLLRLDGVSWERLDRKVRNQVKKAQKSQLTSVYGGSELVEDFYRVFARNMRDLGTPVYPLRFFSEILRAFPDRTRLHVVRLAGIPIAAGLTFRSGTRTEIPWASSVRDHNSLCPNHLLYWDVIQRAMQDGCEIFDFGRSTPDEGTYNFKRQWGAEPMRLHWEYELVSASMPDTSPKNPKFGLAIALWKRLPLSVANRVGPLIVRTIP